ncbi:GyrI-like domain-containing protein [Ferruginibacter yonginensis]|uniref:GyrI-like domain-containing protein n=1 Tax=Ferruginibacter yonginensis TaxID=1310416 RepID=A0ABV8QRT6_9BACT
MAVSAATELPDNMETMLLPSGNYAVFLYKGSVDGAAVAFRYIFETWLPTSGYQLADRPHFELLPPEYNPQSHLSEETIWIPITERL